MRLLGTGRLADVVGDLLPDRGLVVVVGDNRLASALADRSRPVAIAAAAARATAKLDLDTLLFDEDGRLADLEPGAAAGAVIAGAARDPGSAARLAELSRVVSPGSVIVLLDKAARIKASHRALCAGLSRLQQRVVSRTVVTAGVTSSRRSEPLART